ncbi:uncharacterized protein STEHIDRAFT_164029 [Stereum hirsutum FP-91666 SS1]|uniref:DUF6589 domain-containing protein n=1 Tax=Stereum hirsutum (strain FP-91666) TaxID=721885 RepID=R7RXI0_STEHR|nr:uncharacterized protein STEHIDRAFT_164029 [Stereum hirsutum FP-91666 SS1]EIM79072.1 hypothetical protein STEHIDRAFT_164029 [Stereum hirsutum FP-91666 SS1]
MSILDPSPPRPGRKVKGKFDFTPKLPSLFETIEPRPSEDSSPGDKDGGFGFISLGDFLDTLLNSKDPHLSSTATQFAQRHAANLINLLHSRAPDATDDATMKLLIPILQRECQAVQDLLSRDWFIKDHDLLYEFSMERLSSELKKCAPMLWKLLEETSRADLSARDAVPVLTSICAMLSVVRNECANDFQAVMGLFLLASGTSKRELEVLAHAGICISYSSVLRHVKKLSEEGTKYYIKVMENGMCMLVWDNINIAVRVGEQRIHSVNHFDNGTTATLIILYGPGFYPSRVPHGTLPIETKPACTSRQPKIDFTPDLILPSAKHAQQLTESCLWELKQLAMESIPELRRFQDQLGSAPSILQIPVHKTEQFPLPAMKIDELSLDGTFEVISAVKENLKISKGFMAKHGLLFTDGDLLTYLLIDKAESARRNSTDVDETLRYLVKRFGLFHAKMAGGRMVTNQFWGKPNSTWPSSLWRENHVLGRKAMMAGWKGKKSMPWAPSHELLQISLPAHVRDAFHLFCKDDEVTTWAKATSFEEFQRVADKVFAGLFSMKVVDQLRSLPDAERDHIFENTVLNNRDTLLYIVFVRAIKRGDIGCVMNVLRVWMIMMRGVGAMPKKLFLMNWLVNLTGKAGGFKEVDLLQEHQNFWAKVIYAAKGTNKSWKWLSMITVCIFTLHATKEILELADLLHKHKLQQYLSGRPGNSFVTPVDDLLHRGADYANTPKAYAAFRPPRHQAQNIGVPAPGPVDSATSELLDNRDIPLDVDDDNMDVHDASLGTSRGPTANETEEAGWEDEVADDAAEFVTREYLEMDDEERYDLEEEVMGQALSMMREFDDSGWEEVLDEAEQNSTI